jgi:hypothetical protein
MKHKKTIVIKLQDTCRVRLKHEQIIKILKTKDIAEAHYNDLYLDQKIKLCKDHITVDDLAAHQINIVSGA